MDKLLGQLIFFTRVEVVASTDEVRSKIVRLGSVYCDYAECKARLIQFKDLNPHVREVRGEFVFRDYVL
jgi:hypothetical protein